MIPLKRSAGILLPVFSLPSPWGIGTLGEAARDFIRFLEAAGQSYWQVLPLGETSFGDSPYQPFSSYAGNPYLIDLDLLQKDGLLTAEDYQSLPWGEDPRRVDYALLYRQRRAVLRRAAERLLSAPPEDYAAFCRENAFWLEDYTLFTALKAQRKGTPWWDWEDAIRLRRPAALDAARPALDAAKAESARHAGDAARLDALTGQVTQARTALTAYDELDALCREQKQAQDAAQLAGALAAKRRTQLEALDASLAAADTALAVLVDAPTRQLALQNQAAQLEARSTALDALAQRLADSQKQARQARRAQDAYRATAARQDEARARRDALDRAFLDAQAGLLAQELTEGAPCPVCGSTHHPARAVLPRTAPTQVQVEQARQAAEEADRAAQTASAAAQSALAAADEARRSLRRDAEALLPERFAVPEGKPPVQLTFALTNTVLSEETAALQAARTDCTASLRQAGADCRRKAQLEADRQAHTRQRPALEQQVQEADRTAAAQSARVQALEQQVLAKQKALPYPQRAQAQAALDLLEADRTALRAGMEQAEAALRTAQQNYAAAKAAVDALRSQQAAAQSSAPAQPPETLREAAAELTAARDAARGQEKQLAARLLPNRRIMEQYRTAAAQHAALEQRAQWVGALAATAGGTLTSKQKIKLEAYIQMDYLDRILRHANLRLMQMTDAQYELERIGAENQRSQSGLDLGVIDHYNGTRRSVKTLSGGESFKASLALALGLSDEVQSAAGGIRLDTLFLDEGFGSLDEESLEQAIRVLAGLTEGDRLVGIISHVGALKDRIDRQVVVHKNRTGGSTVELVV